MTCQTDNCAAAAAISRRKWRRTANFGQHWRKFLNFRTVQMKQLPPIEGKSVKMMKYRSKSGFAIAAAAKIEGGSPPFRLQKDLGRSKWLLIREAIVDFRL